MKYFLMELRLDLLAIGFLRTKIKGYVLLVYCKARGTDSLWRHSSLVLSKEGSGDHNVLEHIDILKGLS